MQNNAFTPRGPTYAIDNSAASQCLTTDATPATSYRIRNTTAANAVSYIAWAQSAAAVTVTAPVVGTPQGGVGGGGILGMIGTSVEVFVLPPNVFFKAAVGGTFEVTPGEGI